MATVRRFEDLTFWQKARELTRDVYKALKQCDDRGFTDQIQRAAVSVMSNVAEGFESGTRQEFLNYLYIAKGSAGEVRAQLYAAHDIGYIDAETFNTLKCKAEECSKLIATFAKGLKASPYDGHQRKREVSREEREAQEYMAGLRKRLEELRAQERGTVE